MNQKGTQLSMFMSAREIMSNYDPLEGDRRTADNGRYAFQAPREAKETDTQLWGRKLDESKHRSSPVVSSLHETVARNGPVASPVHLTFEGYGSRGKDYIAGGHHRIAAALDTHPDALMPVIHHKSVKDAQDTPNPMTGERKRKAFKYT
jgi:hypothetical protein